jgi:hypothetical protein
VFVISEFTSIADDDVVLVLGLVAALTFLGPWSDSKDFSRHYIRHTSPDFLLPALDRVRGVEGRRRLMWLPATVGAESVIYGDQYRSNPFPDEG